MQIPPAVEASAPLKSALSRVPPRFRAEADRKFVEQSLPNRRLGIDIVFGYVTPRTLLAASQTRFLSDPRTAARFVVPPSRRPPHKIIAVYTRIRPQIRDPQARPPILPI